MRNKTVEGVFNLSRKLLLHKRHTLIRRTLFRLLGLNGYLSVLRRFYVFAYRRGMLRDKAEYKWHYFVPNLLRPGDTIIDIGANLGYFSLVFCEVAGASGKVYSVEPVKPFRLQLSRQLKNAPNNVILDFALGEENIDHIVLGIPEEYKQLGYLRHGLTSLLHGNNAVADEKFTFASSLKRGSEVFAGLDKIDYIKCDIEGYETVVFREMKELIGARRPLVQIESWGEHIARIKELFDALGFKGYKLNDGRLTPLEQTPQAHWGDDDTLFVPDEKRERIARYLD